MQTADGQLTFVVVDRWAGAPQSGSGPRVVLRKDSWDDFHFQTMYIASLRTPDGAEIALGQVKILRKGLKDGRAAIDNRFNELSDEYCSLGQDIEYYEQLMRVDDDLRRRYLEGLRDAAYDPEIEEAFNAEPGWQTSLLRFGQAANALSAGRQLLRGSELRSDQMSFHYSWRPEGAEASIDLEFEFDDSTTLPGRCHALIGYNGVGKTTLLADLAITASSGSTSRSGGTDPSVISGKDTTFGAVIAISYSAFDTFLTPEAPLAAAAAEKENLDWEDGESELISSSGANALFGYVYCGLRRPNSTELKSINEIQSEFVNALDAAKSRDDGGHLFAAFRALSREPSFLRAGVDLLALGAEDNPEKTSKAFGKLSTGHQIVLNIVTQLAAHLRTRSLVLIDEPETHLHPPLTAALLRAIQTLLAGHGSFAIAATHSPVVVQELPAEFVRIVERYDNAVTLQPPEIETFAENIGAITRHVFSLDSSATDYQGVLADLAANYSIEQINNMFASGLSIQGRALVANYLRTQP